MSQYALVKTVSNRYGTFRHLRYERPTQFTDYVVQQLGRKKMVKTSRNVVEWVPKVGVMRTISLGTWGEMVALDGKKLEDVLNNPLHQLFLREQ